MKPFSILILSLFLSLSDFGQQTIPDSKFTNESLCSVSHLKKEIIGTWLEGYCGGGEAWVNSFSFDTNGTYSYHPGTPVPNPLSSINGSYEIVQDTEVGYMLKLKVVSITVNTGYEIDADGDAPSPGIFGYNGWHPKTIPQKDSTFHDHKLKICNRKKADGDNDIACSCIQIDLDYTYYKVADYTEYKK